MPSPLPTPAVTRASGRAAGPEPGHALVVLEPGEPGHAELGVDVGDDLADPAALAAAAADVQDPEPGHRLALRAAELRADHLVAGAHGQDHRAGAGRGGEPAVGAQPPRGEDLRQVLAPAHQVDVAAAGHRLVGVHADGLGIDAAEPGPALAARAGCRGHRRC